MSSVPRTRFSIGELIDGRYEIVEILPTGGMGELYKVRHIHLGDYRVVKLRKPMGKRDETGQKRFAREARLAASIKHQNLATLYDFSSLPDGSHYMVFEFVDGMTIAEHIQAGGRFQTTQVLRVAEQTLRALSALHGAGIIHRDIASDNLMLAVDPSGETVVKVIDLGIAKPLDGEGLTSTGFFVGKARYASPEQVNTHDPVPIDTRSDLYSLGVVLYEMVSGDVPFAASTPAASVIKRLTEDVTAVPPRDTAMILEPDVETFILSLLRRDRTERVQSADEALAVAKTLIAKRPDANDGSTLARITRDRELHKLVAESAAEERSDDIPVPRKGTLEMSLDELQKAQLTDLRDATNHGEIETPHSEEEARAAHVDETEALPKLDKEARDRLMSGSTDESDESDVPTDQIPLVDSDEDAPGEPSDDAAPTMPFKKYKKAMEDRAAEEKAAEEATTPPSPPPPPFMADTPKSGEDPAPPLPRASEKEAPLPPPATPPEPEPKPPRDATPVEPSDRATEQPAAKEPKEEPKPSAAPPASGARLTKPTVIAEDSRGRRKILIILALLAVFALLSIGVAGFAAYQIFKKISSESTPPQPSAQVAGTEPSETAPVTELVEIEPVMYGPPLPDNFVPPAPPPEPKPKPVTPPKPKPEPVVPEPEPEPEEEASPEPPPPPPVTEGDLVQPGPDVQDASIIAKGPLRLPMRARFRRAKGTATVDVLIGINGVPDEVRMVKRSGDADIDDAALEAARNSRFLPATKDGVRVRIWKRLEFGNEDDD